MADVRRLPIPVTAVWDWQLHGSCRDLDSELFFHPERERGPARVQREAQAKRVCGGCPVREQCRAHAMAVREPYGVWGGQSETERGEQLRAQAARTVPSDVGLASGHHRPSTASPGPWPAA